MKYTRARALLNNADEITESIRVYSGNKKVQTKTHRMRTVGF